MKAIDLIVEIQAHPIKYAGTQWNGEFFNRTSTGIVTVVIRNGGFRCVKDHTVSYSPVLDQDLKQIYTWKKISFAEAIEEFYQNNNVIKYTPFDTSTLTTFWGYENASQANSAITNISFDMIKKGNWFVRTEV